MAEPRLATRDARPSDERTFAFDERDFRRVCKLIYAHAGIHLTPQKRDVVHSRLMRRLRAPQR